MPYIAMRRLNVEGDVREVGSEVPEAAHFKNLTAYLAHDHIRWVDKVPEVPAAQPTAVVAPVHLPHEVHAAIGETPPAARHVGETPPSARHVGGRVGALVRPAAARPRP